MDPHDTDHYDSRAEEAIDWYQHYMSIHIEDLAAEFIGNVIHDESEPSLPMAEAMNNRVDELHELQS